MAAESRRVKHPPVCLRYVKGEIESVQMRELGCTNVRVNMSKEIYLDGEGNRLILRTRVALNYYHEGCNLGNVTYPKGVYYTSLALVRSERDCLYHG